jgi:hypothetical protein
MYPRDYLIRILKNKTDLLSDYPAISNYRARAYNYKLEEEKIDYENASWDEEKISTNISGLEKRIARLIGLKSYKRRDLAPDNLFFKEVTANNGQPMKQLILYEDESQEKKLLETKYIETSCCDAIMHAFIDSGCCQENFCPYPEQQAPGRRVHHQQHHAEYSFVLKDEKGRELAHSPVYPSSKRRDEAMKLAKCYLEKICESEGLHMIEHILLRPRGDIQLTELKQEDTNADNTEEVLYGEEFKLLDICLDKCDVVIEKDELVIPEYKFDLVVLPAEECLDGKRWKVALNRLHQLDASGNPLPGKHPVKILEHRFGEFELASDFISKMRELGSELVNFNIYKTAGHDTRYYFKLADKSGRTIVQSSCFHEFSSDPNLNNSPNAIPGARKNCETTIPDRGIVEEIEHVKEFLAYEYDLYCCEEQCHHNEDPYSFRVSFVLPCWAKRFRNKGFRNFVEKVIRMETPAHIRPNIFWLGITEMRDFEDAYFNWIIEMASNDVPDISICNNLTNQVIALKNCDEHCENEDSIYSVKQKR